MRALWSDRQHCSHNVSQKVRRIKRLSLITIDRSHARPGALNNNTASDSTIADFANLI